MQWPGPKWQGTWKIVPSTEKKQMPRVTIPCQTKFHLLTCPAVSHINGQNKPKSIQQEKSLFLLFLQSRYMHWPLCYVFFQCLIFGRCKFRLLNYLSAENLPSFCFKFPALLPLTYSKPKRLCFPLAILASSSSKASANWIQSYTTLFLCLQNKCFS